MPRVLRAARARVPAGVRPEYLRVAGRLARAFAARGQHLWVFEREDAPGELLEFREGPAGARLDAGLPPAEADLDRRLGELAAYREAGVRWRDVPLPGEE